jgi:hypothetical protein
MDKGIWRRGIVRMEGRKRVVTVEKVGLKFIEGEW